MKTKCAFRDRVKRYLTSIVLVLSVMTTAQIQADLFCDFFPAPDCSWAYNPPAYPQCKVGQESYLDGLNIHVDFLWWRACEEGIALGVSDTLSTFSSNPGRNLVRDVSRIKRLQFHDKPGFKIGFERECGYDDWQLALNWTHFHSKAVAHAKEAAFFGSTEELLTSFWERGTDLFPLHSKGTWKLDIDLIDLDLGRRYFVCQRLVLRPYIGLRGARITQTYLVNSETNNAAAPGESNSFISQSKSRANLLAVGPRLGVDMEFAIACGFKVFGQAASSLVFGRFDRHSKEHNKQFGTFSEEDTVDFYYQSKNGLDHCSRAITDLAVGLKWNGCVASCNQIYALQLMLAWEHHMFYRLNTLDFASQGFAIRSGELTGASSKKFGDLSTQGLTVSAQLGF